MRFVYMIFFAVLILGCAPLKKGDYVTYVSNEYLFLNDNFINRSIDCLELGEIRGGGLDVKYCVGENYGGGIVQGFMFENKYSNANERFIGSKISFKSNQVFNIQCNSETKEDSESGIEYINCMIPKRSFDIFAFIMGSNKDVHGKFSAAVGSTKVYDGVINEDGKKLLLQFYKDGAKKDKKEWKKRSL